MTPSITLQEARRCFAAAIREIVAGPHDEWIRVRLDATFGPRLGHLKRDAVRAMLLEEFPELTPAQRRAIEGEFFFPERAIAHWRDLYAEIDRARAATLDEVVRSAWRTWHPDNTHNPENTDDDVR